MPDIFAGRRCSCVRTEVPQLSPEPPLSVSTPLLKDVLPGCIQRFLFPAFVSGEGEDLLAGSRSAETHLVCKKRQIFFF